MDHLQLARDIVKSAAESGAEVEALVMESTTAFIQVNKGEVEKLSQAVSKGLGVRIIDHGRVGYAYTSDFSPPGLEGTWQGALALAKSADADENRSLPEAQPIPPAGDMGIYDPRFADYPTEAKVAFAQQVEETALAFDPRIVLTQRATYQDELLLAAMANSQGFEGGFQRTAAFSWIQAIAKDERGQVQAEGLDFSNFPRELSARKIGEEAAEKALQILGGTPIETRQATVILHPIAGAELLGSIAQAASAEAHQRGRSFLLGKVGQELAIPWLRIIDNGRLRHGFASAPFDSEGVPTSTTTVISEGVLQNLLYDHYTARKDDKRSTGNASRESYRSLPGVAPSNFYLEPSSTPRDKLISEVDEGLYVLRTMNVGGINPVNGDYSVGASGVWIERGQPARPVSGVTIAANMGHILKNIVAVADDLRFVPFFGSIGVPTMRIEGMTIAGI
ncbi:MAG: TldD/PmbA family protein [Chloroflexi bacterium]|nr:TldD/PmbA family protein [Chloroflexota bacterium]